MSSVSSFDTTNEAQLNQLTKFYSQHYRNINPDDPPVPENELRQNLSLSPPGLDIYRWFMEVGAEIVASGGYARPKQGSPEFKSSGHIGQFFVIILDQFRGNGYLKPILNEIVNHAKNNGISKFQYFARNKDAIEISEKLGAKKGPEGGENRLNLIDVNTELIEKWIQDGIKRNPSVKFHHFMKKVPDPHLENFCELYSETINEAPDEGVEYTTILTPSERKEQESDWVSKGQIVHVMVTEEPNGEFSGLTETIYNSENPFAIIQELTGVRNKYRGKGLGKWLKAAMIDYILQNYPKSKIVSTGNADSNKPMMSINERLGFYPHHRNTIYEIDLEKIKI